MRHATEPTLSDVHMIVLATFTREEVTRGEDVATVLNPPVETVRPLVMGLLAAGYIDSSSNPH